MVQLLCVPKSGDSAYAAEHAPSSSLTLRIAVVIPCRGDASLLPQCLGSLSDFIAAGERVVVVNADHSPATTEVAADVGVEVVNADQPQRGRAVAAGIAHLLHGASTAPDVILIAHADMEFSPASRVALIQALGTGARWHWGAMGHRINSPLRRFRVVEAGNRFRATRFQTPYGDQAMFFGVDALAASGGFPQQNRLEDYELSLRLKAVNPPLYVNYPVRISDRHWRQGVVRTSVRNWLTAIHYLVGRTEPGFPRRWTSAAHRRVVI